MEHRLLDKDRSRGRLFWCSIVMISVSFFFIIASAEAVLAQEKYPSKTINFLIGYPAGGTTDICARPLVSAASKILRQPIIVVNKPGGTAAVAMTSLKNEKPDGYAIGILPSGAILSQHMRKVPYDSAKDFTPIIQYAVYLYGFVIPSDSPWKNFKEVIDYAKANPGKIRYSTAGPGSPQHLVMERLALEQKIKWTHIPFEGEPPALSALLGGHVEASSGATGWKKYVESGTLRLLAVYGEKRMDDFPDVPTLLDLGYNIIAPSIICIVGPKGLSPQVVKMLHDAFKTAMLDADFIRVSRQSDQPIIYRDSQDLGRYLETMNEEVGSLIRRLGLRQE